MMNTQMFCFQCEQTAGCILLTLLHLGIKNIRLGPSLPARHHTYTTYRKRRTGHLFTVFFSANSAGICQ